MAALDSAIEKIDGLILDMEKDATSSGASLPELRFDPDDPWSQERAPPPPYVVKARCPKTGYLMTRPFEAQCPMPDAFVKDNSYLRGMIKPVVKSKSSQAAAPSTSESKPKAKEGKSVGEVEDFVKVLFKVRSSSSVFFCPILIGLCLSFEILTPFRTTEPSLSLSLPILFGCPLLLSPSPFSAF